MCDMLDRVLLQNSGFRKIIAQKSIEIDELKEEITELEFTTEHLRKEKEDLEKHVTRN
jgi:FtsZ-binding cell division protein ZapB|tara:strand:- start:597 stop:770 length:174 start_codon:yes stop_codon:yes gene_type:complete